MNAPPPITPTQLDLFTALPNAAVVSDWADTDDGPYPCDRCGRESDSLAEPHQYTHVLWCSRCRTQASLCLGCGDEVDSGEMECVSCRSFSAYENATSDHYGDR